MVIPEITVGQKSEMDHPRIMKMLKFVGIQRAIECKKRANDENQDKGDLIALESLQC